MKPLTYKRIYKRFFKLGCGIGRHSYLFPKNGFDVDSLDYSETAMQEVIYE